MFGHRIRSAGEGLTTKISCRARCNDVIPRKAVMPARSTSSPLFGLETSRVPICVLATGDSARLLSILNFPFPIRERPFSIELSKREPGEGADTARVLGPKKLIAHPTAYQDHVIAAGTEAHPGAPCRDSLLVEHSRSDDRRRRWVILSESSDVCHEASHPGARCGSADDLSRTVNAMKLIPGHMATSLQASCGESNQGSQARE